MEYSAGIDVSLELSHVCVVDGLGKIFREARVMAVDPSNWCAFCKCDNVVQSETPHGSSRSGLAQCAHR